MNYKTRIGYWTLFLFIVISGLYLFQNNIVTAVTNETINSTLEIWHTDNVYVNETFTIYANYSYENGSISGFEVCTFNTNYMDFNMISGLYYYEDLYESTGNYSYKVNCHEDGYQNLTETSEIEILPLETNSTVDNDGDGYPENVDCDDNDADVNPGQNETLYNGKDDDCNPATLDYLFFDITTEQSIYNPGETVKININAYNGSDTYLTINTPTNVSYVYIFSDGYPVTQQFSLTTLSGIYSIEGVNYYENYTNTDNAEFSIDNTFNVNIQVDEDEVYEDEEIHFEAIITGAIGNVNLVWNMDDGTEKYSTEFDYTYDNSGTYNVVLIATDDGQNQIIKTKEIKVNKKLQFKVKVLENNTNNIIEDATVKLDSDKETTNENGMVEYTVTNETYELKVIADGYYTYEEDVKINKSTTFTVKLNVREEEAPPLITLVSPKNNSQISKGEFKFKFTDDSNADCSLYISEGNGWWVDYNTSKNLQKNKEYTFKVNLDYGEYYWRITCTDVDDNTAYSPEYLVTITSSGTVALTTNEPETTYNVVQDVYNVIPDFDTYSPDEKKIVEYLEMDVLIKDAKRKLDMANRDLFNLKYQPDSISLINKREEIYADIDQIKDTTPLSVSAKDKVEFVKYVDDSELEQLFDEYIELKYLELSKKDKKKLTELNKELQKKTTIETKAYVVEIKYISGRTEEVTVIARSIDFGVTKNLMYVEFVPKELVESSDNIVFVTKPDRILNKDPVFEISAEKVSEIVYYIKDKVSLDKIPKIKPVVLTTIIDDNSGNTITGLAIFDSIGFSESNKTVFIIEMLIVFILLGIYLFYYYRSSGNELKLPWKKDHKTNVTVHTRKKHSNVLKEPSDPHKISYIRNVIRQTNQLLNNNNLKKAALKYYEVKFLYDLLEEHDKKAIFDDIIDLSDGITYRHIQELIDSAIIELAKNNYDNAHELYDEIQIEFDKLSEEHQAKIYSKCCELALHLKND